MSNDEPTSPVGEVRQLLRTERIRARLTQVELAARLGCSRKRISEFEMGLTDPPFSFVASYAAQVGRPLRLGERPSATADFIDDIVDK